LKPPVPASLHFQRGGKKVTPSKLSADGSHPVQVAWMAEDVPQCGYCQSGQYVRRGAAVEKIHPTDADIDDAMSGKSAAAGTYQRIAGYPRAADANRQSDFRRLAAVFIFRELRSVMSAASVSIVVDF